MFMFLNAKKLAFLGLLLACTVLLVILSGIIETNTLFLLAGASYCVGIAIHESGLRFGFGFYIASILLSFILAPNKLYCITFSAMGLYLVLMELSWELLAKHTLKKDKNILFWMIKLAIFNIIYLPIIIYLPKLVYQGTIDSKLFAVALAGGQLGIFIYDMAYNYFQKFIWGKVRGRFY